MDIVSTSSVFKKLHATEYNWQCCLKSYTHTDIYTYTYIPMCVYSLLVNKDSQNSGKYVHRRNWRWWPSRGGLHLTGLHLAVSLSWSIEEWNENAQDHTVRNLYRQRWRKIAFFKLISWLSASISEVLWKTICFHRNTAGLCCLNVYFSRWFWNSYLQNSMGILKWVTLME